MQVMTHPIEASVQVMAPPQTVYAIWANVPQWPQWDPDTRMAFLDGPLAPGAKGRLTPRKGFSVAMVVTDAVDNERFTVECPVLGNVMRFEHLLYPAHGGVQVIHRVSFHGLLAWLLRRTVGRDVRHGLPQTLVRLKAHAESRVGRAVTSAACVDQN